MFGVDTRCSTDASAARTIPHPRLPTCSRSSRPHRHPAQARPYDEPFDHATGKGRVAAHKGHYADGLAKGKTVVLLLTETTGAVEGTAVGALRAYTYE